MRPTIPLIPLAAAAALVIPASASAAVTCTYDKVVDVAEVDVTGASTTATVSRAPEPGTAVLVDGQPCGPADVTKTIGIIVTDSTNAGTRLVLDTSKGRLAASPAANDLFVAFHGDGGDDTIDVRAPEAEEDHIAAGALGVNLDAEKTGIADDADLTWDPGVTRLSFTLGEGDDSFTAAGGDGTGGALGLPVAVHGGAQDDTLRGSDQDDELHGDADADTISAGGGDDLVDGGNGSDTLAGGPGRDTASYANALSATAVDLRAPQHAKGLTGDDALSGFEDVIGSPYGDTLTGDDAVNRLSGGLGDDTLQGGGGADLLACGPGADTARIDAQDTRTDCETELTPALPPVMPPAPSPGTASRALRVTAAVLAGQRPRSVRRHGLRVRVACSAACTLAGRLRSTRGARLGGLRRRRLGTRATVVALRLDAAARRRLAHHGHLRGAATLTARDAAGHRATRSVRIRL